MHHNSNFEARKLISDTIIALPPENVHLLEQGLQIIQIKNDMYITQIYKTVGKSDKNGKPQIF